MTPGPPIIFSLLEQFLMYIDSVGLDGPTDMETDGPPLDDVGALKKTVEEEATQVRKTDVSNTESLTVITTSSCGSTTPRNLNIGNKGKVKKKNLSNMAKGCLVFQTCR